MDNKRADQIARPLAPAATDLEETRLRVCQLMGARGVSAEHWDDIRDFIVAYDAQAARLAAVDALLESWIAACCGVQVGQRDCESFGCPDLQELRAMMAPGAVVVQEAHDGE